MYGKKSSNGAVPTLRKGRQPAKPPAPRAKQVWRAKRPAVDPRIGAAATVSFEPRGQRAQATRLERNDGSNVTASGLGLNSHYTTLGRAHSTVRTSQDCVPRTYRRMRERWCLTHIRRPLGQLEAPTSSCRLRVANLTWSTLLKSHRAARHLLAQHEAGGQVPTF